MNGLIEHFPTASIYPFHVWNTQKVYIKWLLRGFFNTIIWSMQSNCTLLKKTTWFCILDKQCISCYWFNGFYNEFPFCLSLTSLIWHICKYFFFFIYIIENQVNRCLDNTIFEVNWIIFVVSNVFGIVYQIMKNEIL